MLEAASWAVSGSKKVFNGMPKRPDDFAEAYILHYTDKHADCQLDKMELQLLQVHCKPSQESMQAKIDTTRATSSVVQEDRHGSSANQSAQAKPHSTCMAKAVDPRVKIGDKFTKTLWKGGTRGVARPKKVVKFVNQGESETEEASAQKPNDTTKIAISTAQSIIRGRARKAAKVVDQVESKVEEIEAPMPTFQAKDAKQRRLKR